MHTKTNMCYSLQEFIFKRETNVNIINKNTRKLPGAMYPTVPGKEKDCNEEEWFRSLAMPKSAI